MLFVFPHDFSPLPSVYDCKGNRFLEQNRGWKALDCQKILLQSSIVSVCVSDFAIDFWISNLLEGSFLRRFSHQENMLSGNIRVFILVPAVKEEVWFVVPTTAVMSLPVATEVGGDMGVFMVSTLRPSLVLLLILASAICIHWFFWFSAILVLLTIAPSNKHLEILAKFLQTGVCRGLYDLECHRTHRRSCWLISRWLLQL